MYNNTKEIMSSLWVPIAMKEPSDFSDLEVHEKNNHNLKCIFDCELPKDGERVLVSCVDGYVRLTYFMRFGASGYFANFTSEEITAWMPSPPTYKSIDMGRVAEMKEPQAFDAS